MMTSQGTSQAISHAAKPLTYYISAPCIDALVSEFGPYLQKVSPLQKMLLSAVFFDYLAGASAHYSIDDSLALLDPDCLLEEELTQFAAWFAEESSATTIASFLQGMAALVADDIRNAS